MFTMGELGLSVLLFGLLFAILGYRLAKRRNREAWLWAVQLLVELVRPLAVPLAALPSLDLLLHRVPDLHFLLLH